MRAITHIRIEAPHFVAGAEVSGGKIVRTAPIIHYMLGWSVDDLNEYCRRREWLLDYTYEQQLESPFSPRS